jgi:hypothetical protein
MVDVEKIIDKIKKLLALANNNPSEEEAKAAMLKAQELMAQYDVNVESSDSEKIEYASVICEHKWDMGFRKPLAVVLAKNFKCRMFLQNSNVVFVGHKQDALIAKQVFEYAYEYALKEGNKHYNQAYAMERRTKGVFNSYTAGFIKGLEQSFDKQCTALMIVVPKDVNDRFEEMSAGWKVQTSRLHIDRIYTSAYNAGMQDGKTIMNGRRLEG